MKNPRKPQDQQTQQERQKSSASTQSSERANPKTPSRSDGTFLDRINLPAMSGEEALRRYDGHLRKYAGQDEKHDPGDGNAAANKPESTVVQEPLKEQGTERLGNRAVHPKDGQKGQEGQKGHEASSRADLAALAEWPLLTRIIGLIGTLGMLVALIVLGLFVAGWLSGL